MRSTYENQSSPRSHDDLFFPLLGVCYFKKPSTKSKSQSSTFDEFSFCSTRANTLSGFWGALWAQLGRCQRWTPIVSRAWRREGIGKVRLILRENNKQNISRLSSHIYKRALLQNTSNWWWWWWRSLIGRGSRVSTRQDLFRLINSSRAMMWVTQRAQLTNSLADFENFTSHRMTMIIFFRSRFLDAHKNWKFLPEYEWPRGGRMTGEWRETLVTVKDHWNHSYNYRIKEWWKEQREVEEKNFFQLGVNDDDR